MRKKLLILLLGTLGFGQAAQAQEPEYLQCVPFARQISGIQITGDAHSWWQAADNKYAKGNRPQQGAVLAFKQSDRLRLGHVAAVSKVIDSRTVLLTHANWSPINGRRGQIERDVKAIDVSPGNDWTQVRVWYAPIADLGTSAFAAHGFIYPAAAPPTADEKPRRSRLGSDFLAGIEPEQPTLGYEDFGG